MLDITIHDAHTITAIPVEFIEVGELFRRSDKCVYMRVGVTEDIQIFGRCAARTLCVGLANGVLMAIRSEEEVIAIPNTHEAVSIVALKGT